MISKKYKPLTNRNRTLDSDDIKNTIDKICSKILYDMVSDSLFFDISIAMSFGSESINNIRHNIYFDRIEHELKI